MAAGTAQRLAMAAQPHSQPSHCVYKQADCSFQAPGKGAQAGLWFSTWLRWIDTGQANSTCTHSAFAFIHPSEPFLCFCFLNLSSREKKTTTLTTKCYTMSILPPFCNQVSWAKRCEIAYCFVNQIRVLVVILVSGAKPAKKPFPHDTRSMQICIWLQMKSRQNNNSLSVTLRLTLCRLYEVTLEEE